MIGAAFGLGFIIGPATGGLLSQWGYNLPAFAAAGVSFINLGLIYFLLPESLTEELRASAALRKKPPFTVNALFESLQRPGVGPLLHIRFFYGLAFVMFQNIFSLFAQAIGLSSQTTGYVLAYVGILSVITQVGLIAPLTKRYRENVLIITGLWILGLSLLAWAFTRSLIPLQSAISKSVSREEVGGMLGISSSLEAFTRVIAPTIGGLLLQNLGIWAPGVFSAVIMIWVVLFTYRRIIIPGKQNRVAATN
jgi:DHA1 family tetracycline resistance protein-like MFS transporter